MVHDKWLGLGLGLELGVRARVRDENMTMLDHTSSVCQRCYYQLQQIRRVRKSLSAASKLLLVLASVHSRLDYCNSVLHSLPRSRLQLLQSVLNSVARLICGLGRFDHIKLVRIDLHWLPFPQRISYKICLLMFKCLKGLAPVHLSDLYVGTAAVVGRACLRSAAWGDLVVPGHRDRVGFKVFCCGWSEMLEQIAGWTQRFVGWSWDFHETLENTLVQSWFFWLGMHFWVRITFCRVRYNVRLIINNNK